MAIKSIIPSKTRSIAIDLMRLHEVSHEKTRIAEIAAREGITERQVRNSLRRAFDFKWKNRD